MPENETANAGETTTETTAAEVKAFEAIESQEDLDRIIQKRIERERARFSDYDDLKAAAAKLSAIEESSKSDAEKASERLAAAEKRATELEAKALRAEVANTKGVPAALLYGSTEEELEASADALIAFRGEQKPAPGSTALGRVNGAAVTAGPSEAFGEFLKNQLGR